MWLEKLTWSFSSDELKNYINVNISPIFQKLVPEKSQMNVTNVQQVSLWFILS